MENLRARIYDLWTLRELYDRTERKFICTDARLFQHKAVKLASSFSHTQYPPSIITLAGFSDYAILFQMSLDRLGIILPWDGVSLSSEILDILFYVCLIPSIPLSRD